VGADGVLVVAASRPGRIRVTFFNPDGGEAFCGNGTRCAARYACLHGLAAPRMVVEARPGGDLPADVVGAMVRLSVPLPEDRGVLVLDHGDERISGRLIDAGVPHFVISATDVTSWPLASRGPWLRRHAALGAAGANVDVVAEAADGSLRIRTWERGVEGETLACGSGALAAARLALERGRRGRIQVMPASGIPLIVDLGAGSGRPDRLGLEGDARIILDGEVSAEAVEGTGAC
jgi:diaminopimelate epimerase